MKKVIALAAVVASAAVVLAGCSATDPGTGEKHVTLSFWHGYTEADGKVLDKIVADFNKSQSGITIKDTTKTWAQIGDTLLTSLSAKQGPDLVALPAENLPV